MRSVLADKYFHRVLKDSTAKMTFQTILPQSGAKKVARRETSGMRKAYVPALEVRKIKVLALLQSANVYFQPRQTFG